LTLLFNFRYKLVWSLYRERTCEKHRRLLFNFRYKFVWSFIQGECSLTLLFNFRYKLVWSLYRERTCEKHGRLLFNFRYKLVWSFIQGSKKSRQHLDFPGGHPPEYYPSLRLLNFAERTGYGVLSLIWPSTQSKVCKWYHYMTGGG
jgi:hypothetical protein